MIKFDLHIHSVASKYKEEIGIVEDSTIDNVNVLLSKLNEYQVALFSITDHNRFDAKLYHKINSILNAATCPYEYVKTLLPGVEFDVVFDGTMSKCHVIAIFNVNNDDTRLDFIEAAINKKMLNNKDDSYTKEDFEKLLCDINLDTILIACQRSGIDRHNGKQNSLSDSTMDVEQILKIGYINALEFQKPKVEGILISNLKDIPRPIGLVTGSDCHEWTSYPYHDKKNRNLSFRHSKANILPTFKGLLMAVTSPETRFNCRENSNPIYIDKIKVKDKIVTFTNGINAIIGENGSGKSTLLKLLNHDTREKYIQNIIRKSKLSLSAEIDTTKIKYIKQGEIINKFNNNKQVFSVTDNNYKDVDNGPFIEAYNKYSQSILNHIKHEIRKKEIIDLLEKYEVKYCSELEEKVYYINVICPKDFDTIVNIHDDPLRKVEKLIYDIDDLRQLSYFQKYKEELSLIRKNLYLIYATIFSEHNKVSVEEKVKNIICSCITDYTSKITNNSSSKDREIREYNDKKQRLIDAVYEAIQTSNTVVQCSSSPEPIKGSTSSSKRGFYFNREAKYNNASMLDNFLSFMFLKEYCTIENVVKINSNNELVQAIRGCTSVEDIDIKWKENFDKFLHDSIQVKDYITDNANKRIGNTLGEMSLSYYKYFTQDSEDWNILIIDQPEDNISNNNISKYLINYFNSLRDKKQLIFVTHNPLLVVNLDVDNVIYVQNNDDELSIVNGRLEYEDNNTDILEIVAKNMDGGRESIEKRLKVYGKDNQVGYESR